MWGLATMSKSKDVTIARLCSVALCNLSCEYWKDIAMSNCMQVVAPTATRVLELARNTRNALVTYKDMKMFIIFWDIYMVQLYVLVLCVIVHNGHQVCDVL